MVRKILVAVDFSPYSKKVLEQALVCAKAWKAQEVELIHVIAFVPRVIGAPNRLEITESYLEKVEEKIRKQFKTKSLKIKISIGVPFEEILTHASSSKPDMIFLGYKSKSLVERFFIGTTAERVALKSSVPVWVHRGSKVKVPKTVLVPYDFSPASDQAVALAAGLPGVKMNKVHILYASQPVVPLLDYPSWQYLEETHNRWLKDSKIQLKQKFKNASITISEGVPAEVICRLGRKSDLTVMATQGEGKILGTIGSVTARVLKTSPAPVLIIKA